MMFYVEQTGTHPRTYALTSVLPDKRRSYCFAPTPEFVVHSKLHGTHEKAQPYVVRGVNTQGRLLVQTTAESVTAYHAIDSWHEVDGGDTTEGYRFRRYALKPMMTLLKLATNAYKDQVRDTNARAKLAERDEKCGVCPVCFGDFVVTTNHDARAKIVHTKMVHHGYERPGHGYIVGDCHGVGHEPFEISCVGTISWLGVLKQALAVRFDALAYLDERNEIVVEISRAGRVRPWVSAREANTKTLKRGEAGFDAAIELRRVELAGEIDKVSRDIATYTAKIADWAPVAWPRRKMESK